MVFEHILRSLFYRNPLRPSDRFLLSHSVVTRIEFSLRMPYTLSHPLAIVPLARWCPRYFNFAALVIGSMSPDFGYFANAFETAKYAHTLTGLFAVCVPASMALLGLFYLLRGPMCFILPQPHRAALTPLTIENPNPSFRVFLVASCSALLGAITHIVWDSFTHWDSWTVQHFAVLRRPVMTINGTEEPVCYMLQIVCSLVGGVGLAVLYLLWLRRQPIRVTEDSQSDGWRYALLAGVVLVSLMVALAAAYYHTLPYKRGPTFNEFVYWIIVYATSAFFPLVSLSALIVFLGKRAENI